jgi:protein tyrosine phosphatase
MDYAKGSSGNARDIMREIHSVIESPSKGPILVHCMWGVHSSGGGVGNGPHAILRMA